MRFTTSYENGGCVSKERASKYGEIFTPRKLAEEMVDDVIKSSKRNDDMSLTCMDPCCGKGIFLIVWADRLMAGLKDVIPNWKIRHKHIVEHMIYGVDIIADNVEDTVKALHAENYKHHIRQADFLAVDVSNAEWWAWENRHKTANTIRSK
jgi:type I restriction-modification system DNA methylase subunit